MVRRLGRRVERGPAFFVQLALLAGYAYAHVLVRYLTAGAQRAAHGALLAASCALLPILPSPAWKPSGAEDPALRILALLPATIGLPYAVLSATSPLPHAWSVRRPDGALPYRLFALSNAGAMLALVSYPLAVEPWLTSRQQAYAWSGAYVLFAALCAAAGEDAVVRLAGRLVQPGTRCRGRLLRQGVRHRRHAPPVARGRPAGALPHGMLKAAGRRCYYGSGSCGAREARGPEPTAMQREPGFGRGRHGPVCGERLGLAGAAREGTHLRGAGSGTAAGGIAGAFACHAVPGRSPTGRAPATAPRPSAIPLWPRRPAPSGLWRRRPGNNCCDPEGGYHGDPRLASPPLAVARRPADRAEGRGRPRQHRLLPA